jgi:hypothetical protein
MLARQHAFRATISSIRFPSHTALLHDIRDTYMRKGAAVALRSGFDTSLVEVGVQPFLFVWLIHNYVIMSIGVLIEGTTW